MIATKYVVKFNYIDGDGNLNECRKLFDSHEEAKKFRDHIIEVTEELLNQYGRCGVYNPYSGIELSKEVVYDKQK